MKKVLTALCCALAVACSAALFAACDDGTTPAHEHTWDNGTVTQEATCTEDGVRTFRCTGCDETKTEPIDALGHDWGNAVVTEAATYTRPGKGVETCSRCGETRDTVIEAVAYTADATVEAGDSIQDAIDAADAGDVIVVEAGTYAEQLVIGKVVTIIGEGEVVIAGPADYTTIESADKLAVDTLGLSGYSALVLVEDADVTLENVTVRGDKTKASAVQALTHTTAYVGVAAVNASVTLNCVDIADITYTDHLVGMQNGFAVYGVAGEENCKLTVRYSTLTGFNKAAAVVRAGVSSFVFEGNTVTGAGEQGQIAQNGVQVHCESVITGNTFEDLMYAPDPTNADAHGSWAVLSYAEDEDAVTVTGNAFSACDNGVYAAVNGNTVCEDNTFADMYEEGEDYYEEPAVAA